MSKLCVGELCARELRVTGLCVRELCVSKLCVRELCVRELCVREFCVSKLCVKELCVRELAGHGRTAEGADGRAQPKTRTPPTQRCGEKGKDTSGALLPLWRVARSQVKSVKAGGLRTLFQIKMSTNCTLLWCEAHFEVKMFKTHHVRCAFGRSPRNNNYIYNYHYYYTTTTTTTATTTTLHYTTLH